MSKFDTGLPHLFTHPACSCGSVIDLVRKTAQELIKKVEIVRLK